MYKTADEKGPMESVMKTVCTVLNLPNNGGRLLTRDNHTLLLMDYDFLPHSAVQLIADQHPFVTIETHPCESSNSGYVVVFTRSDRQNLFASAVCMQLCLTFVFVAVIATLPVFDCWKQVL